MTNLVTRNGKPNVENNSGYAYEFKPGFSYMIGPSHENGGIDIGDNLEVEGGEVVQVIKNKFGKKGKFKKGGNADTMRVYSDEPMLDMVSPTGELIKISPAKFVLKGGNPDIAFAGQEDFKNRFGINDDGTMKAALGLNVSTKDNEDNKYMTFSRMIKTLGDLYYNAKLKNATKDNVNEENNVNEEAISYYPSLETVQYIKGKEAFRPNIYLDSKGIPTIGYGTTQSTKAGKNAFKLYKKTGMTEEQASSVFNETVREMLPNFISATPNFDKLNNNQRNALFSYYYNVGHGGYTRKSPKLQQALKDFNLDEVVNQMDFGYYDTKNPGLRKRRDEERALFNMKSMGGIHIDKNKRGTFTAAATKHGMGVQEFASRVLANKEDYSPAMVDKANFAKNVSRWKKPVGGIVSVNGNVKNGLVYTGRAKAKYGKYVPLIQNVKNIVFENGEAYVKDDKGRIRKATNTELDAWNKFYGNDSNFEEVPVNVDRSNTVAIEQRNNISPQILSYLHAKPSTYGAYSTNKPAFTMLGMRPGWSHTYREPVNPLADFVVPRIDLAELQQNRTPVRNNTNNRIAPNSANNTIIPNTVNVYGISLDGKPVLQGTREVPQWIGSGRDDTPLNVFDNFTNVNGRGVQNNLVTIGNRQLSTSPIIPVTLPGVERVKAAVQQTQPVPDTTGGGFDLTDPNNAADIANIAGSIGSYFINEGILDESEHEPTKVRLNAQKLRTTYTGFKPQLDELREQAAANNRLIANNSPSTRLSVARRNLINTNLARDIAKLYGIKADKETELVNQDTLNSQGVRNQEAIYNAQLRADYQNRLDELNRLRLANNTALFSGLTGGINSIADSLLRQRYYNNTIGAIGARNPNVDARIFRDAGVDWNFMYPYSTRNRS